MRNSKNKDNRIDCFFKPSNSMLPNIVSEIVDTISGAGISIYASTHSTSIGFFIVPQRVSIEKRDIIERTIRIITDESPLWMFIEQEDGTTYSYLI